MEGPQWIDYLYVFEHPTHIIPPFFASNYGTGPVIPSGSVCWGRGYFWATRVPRVARAQKWHYILLVCNDVTFLIRKFCIFRMNRYISKNICLFGMSVYGEGAFSDLFYFLSFSDLRNQITLWRQILLIRNQKGHNISHRNLHDWGGNKLTDYQKVYFSRDGKNSPNKFNYIL